MSLDCPMITRCCNLGPTDTLTLAETLCETHSMINEFAFAWKEAAATLFSEAVLAIDLGKGTAPVIVFQRHCHVFEILISDAFP